MKTPPAAGVQLEFSGVGLQQLWFTSHRLSVTVHAFAASGTSQKDVLLRHPRQALGEIAGYKDECKKLVFKYPSQSGVWLAKSLLHAVVLLMAECPGCVCQSLLAGWKILLKPFYQSKSLFALSGPAALRCLHGICCISQL